MTKCTEGKKIFRLGDIVQHKTNRYQLDWMIVVRYTNDGTVECRYFNEAMKKYTLQVFYEFELKKVKK